MYNEYMIYRNHIVSKIFQILSKFKLVTYNKFLLSRHFEELKCGFIEPSSQHSNQICRTNFWATDFTALYSIVATSDFSAL